MNIFFLVLAIFALIFLGYLYYLLVLARFIHKGPPYVGMKEEKVKKIIKMLEIKAGDKAVDLGSGDGRLVIALTKAGAEAHGFEINPFLVWISRRRIRNLGLEKRAFIHKKSFWHEDLSSFNKVTLFGLNFIMKGLEKKLQSELKQGSFVAVNAFKFPTWPVVKENDHIFLYTRRFF